MDISAWPELKGFLNSLPEPINIVTDPVTGYFVRGATKHHAEGFKFHNFFDSVAIDKVFQGGKPKHLMHPELTDRFLIINQKDGPLSQLGATSGHWPGDVLKVSHYYPLGLQAVIDNNPERFLSVGQVNGAAIYRLKPYRLDEIDWNTFK